MKALVDSFVPLNRRRALGHPPLSIPELETWSRLRDELERIVGEGPGNAGQQRRSLRVPVHLKVTVGGPGADLVGRVIELSEGGLFIATGRPLPSGTPLYLEITDDGGALLHVEAEVRWVRPKLDVAGPTGMGIRFGPLDPSAKRVVLAWVEASLHGL